MEWEKEAGGGVGELTAWLGPLHAGWGQAPERVWKVNRGNAKCSTGRLSSMF